MCAKQTDDERAGSPRPAFSSALGDLLRSLPVGAWIALALVLGLLIGFFAARQYPGNGPAAPQPKQANATRTYEEYHAGELENRIKLVDSAIFNSLRSVKPEADRLQVQSVEGRKHNGREFFHQTIRLSFAATDRPAFVRHLTKELSILVPGAQLSQPMPTQWDIAIDGQPTHTLVLPAEADKAKPRPQAGKGRMAIVIDDMGEDVGLAQGLAALDVPVSFSIWPDSGSREAVLKIAKAKNREILIHLPMQPKGYPKVDPGKNPLLVTMTAEQIQATVRRAVDRVPGAIGLNNHMGSQFTENAFGMHAALQALKDKGLFFLDSRTTAETVGEHEAQRLGLRFYKRDVFLDNEQNVSAILLQLRKAEALARSRGNAIAIGHPHPETLQAIKQWLKDKDDGVSVVPLASLPLH